MSAASTSLSVAVSNAVAYLTRPLVANYPPTMVNKLQLLLEANLTALYAPTWVVREPLRGSGRRCLSLSADCLPPRAIYNACIGAGMQWFDWIAALGDREFDFVVDPGHIYLRFGNQPPVTIWSSDADATPTAAVFDEARIQRQIQSQVAARKKTLAQQLLEDDEEEDERLFAMIANEVSEPTWMTPTLDQFPIARSTSPTLSTLSRSSSRSSNSSSSGFSFSSTESVESLGSYNSSSSSSSSTPASKQSRRERARQARVFVDTTKTEVTPYDGGKTTVLTGGVMLGGGAKKPAAKPASHWRSSSRS